MSEPDDGVAIGARLHFKASERSLNAFEKALFDGIRSNARVSVSTKRDDKNLYIDIDAKDINILRIVIDNYLNTIKMLKEVDKL
ncbi:MAG: hypothetical protein M1348_00040 [Candidatus Parvarchaeota archaeon]|nr:hypothetical protein [Candidatus Parvarchaeota archaeon]MCL5100989.1 hypothetical protein [Candidatus Parvarchaeota archaeon]